MTIIEAVEKLLNGNKVRIKGGTGYLKFEGNVLGFHSEEHVTISRITTDDLRVVLHNEWEVVE